jgi:hypothetical protein
MTRWDTGAPLGIVARRAGDDPIAPIIPQHPLR